MSSVLRLLVCGDDAGRTATLAESLTRTASEALQITVVDIFDRERSALPLCQAAIVSDVAVIVVDGKKGVTRDTSQRALWLLALGVRRVVLAVSDLSVKQDEGVWRDVEHVCVDLSARFGSMAAMCVPLSAVSDVLARVESVRDIESMPGASIEASKANRFEAAIVWLSRERLLQSRSYAMSIGAETVSATVAPLKYRLDAQTLQPIPAKALDYGDVGVCNLELTRPVAFDAQHRRFVLLDERRSETVGVGLLHFALRRSQNVRWQTLDIDKERRAALMSQKPCVVWFTGLSGAGKSTIANLVEKRLHGLGRHTYLLDGDNVRHGLNKDLGFTDADRVENIRRVAEVARLMIDAGLMVLVSFISPFRSERRMARALVGKGEFVEVFVDTPLDVAESRDPKGLYGKARRGELRNFTGVDSPYEMPEHAEIRLDTTRLSAEESADAILDHLEQMEIIRRS